MAKKDLTGDMKSGLDGLLSSTKRTVSEKPQAAPVAKKRACGALQFCDRQEYSYSDEIPCHRQKYATQRHCERGYEGVSGEAWEMTRLIPRSPIFMCVASPQPCPVPYADAPVGTVRLKRLSSIRPLNLFYTFLVDYFSNRGHFL